MPFRPDNDCSPAPPSTGAPHLATWAILRPQHSRYELTGWSERFPPGDGTPADGWTAQATADMLLLARAQPAALPHSAAGTEIYG